jgi:WD40 repeat protein
MAGSVLQYTADSQTVVAGYVNGRMAGYSARDGAELWNLPSAHRGAVNCITATDKLLVTGGADGVTRVWLASNHAFVTQLNSHAMKPVVGVRIDCRQPHLLHSAGLDRSVTIFDLKTEGRIVTHQLREGSNMTGLTQRSDSEQESITSTSDGRLCFWDVDVQPHPVATIQDESRVKINSIALGPGGRYLAAALEDTTVKVFDIQSLTLVATLSAHSGPVTSVAWSPDQRQLVSVGSDCTICVWNFYLD